MAATDLCLPSTLTMRRYHTDQEFRANYIAKSVEYIKNRRQNDPVFDENIKEQWRNNSRKYAQDPEKHAKKLLYDRERARRIREEKKLSKGT
jgi:hypothetical protein